MSLHRCVFAVQFDARTSPEIVERRVRTLAAWYACDGRCPAIVTQLPSAGMLVGSIDLEGGNHDGRPFVWGGPMPLNLSSNNQIVDATDLELRTLGSTVAVIATARRKIRIATGVGGVAGMYWASRDGVVAWSSHAVAASWLAAEHAAVEWSSVPELLAMGFVGDDRTLLTNVRTVPDASVIDIERSRVTHRCYWPAEERWTPVPEIDARARCADLLLERLPTRVNGAAPVLGLTAGLDSRVMALALRKVGVDFRTMTAGDPAWREVQEASKVAAAIEVPHAPIPIAWHTDDEALATMTELVRWSDGTVVPALARDSLADAEAMPLITGGAGEVGRAFYYATHGSRQSSPTTREVLSRMDPSGAIPDARLSARRSVITAVRRGIHTAELLGFEDWRALDVFYAEQRLRKWGRSTLPKTSGTVTIGFGDPPLLAALVSLPLADRLADGFHRDFLAQHGGQFGLQPHPGISQGSSGGGGHTRAERARILVRTGRRLLPRRRRSSAAWAGNSQWLRVPAFHDLTLRSCETDQLKQVMGARWCRGQRESFAAGETAATVGALRCAAIATLAQGLDELRQAAKPEF